MFVSIHIAKVYLRFRLLVSTRRLFYVLSFTTKLFINQKMAFLSDKLEIYFKTRLFWLI